jgi:hypothetical protein
MHKVQNSVIRKKQSASILKNAVFWDVTPCGFVRTDVSEERIASIMREKRIGEIGTTLAVTTNRSTLRVSVASYC